MVIRQLEYLVALAQERHFGRAARRCNISQPTLSAALRDLEHELGMPLVERGRRFGDFTAEGARVLEWAERILADRDAMVQELGEMRGDLHGRLRIGVVPTALPIVARLTGPFCGAHPHVSVTVEAMSSTEIQAGLDNFAIEVGITYLDNEPVLRAQAIPLYRERYCLLVADGGPLADAASLTWRQAAAHPLCLLTRDMQNRRIIDAAFDRAGLHAEPQVETNSVSNLGLHVATGHWASVVPHHLIHTLGVPANTRAIPLTEPEISHQVGVVTAAREPAPPTASALLRVVTGYDEQDLIGPLIAENY